MARVATPYDKYALTYLGGVLSARTVVHSPWAPKELTAP